MKASQGAYSARWRGATKEGLEFDQNFDQPASHLHWLLQAHQTMPLLSFWMVGIWGWALTEQTAWVSDNPLEIPPFLWRISTIHHSPAH